MFSVFSCAAEKLQMCVEFNAIFSDSNNVYLSKYIKPLCITAGLSVMLKDC